MSVPEQGYSSSSASLRRSFPIGSRFRDQDGRMWRFVGLDDEGLWRIKNGDERLKLPGEHGLPVPPSERMVADAIRNGTLKPSRPPLAKPIRAWARDRERTMAEVLAADPKAALRMATCRAWDSDLRKGRKLTTDLPAVADWIQKRLAGDPLAMQFGTPSAAAVAQWVAERGGPNDRLWCDMEDVRGQGTRRRRIDGFSLAMALWHATRVHSRRTLTPAAAHRALKRDFFRALDGKPLKMDRFDPVAREATDIKLMDETTFRKLVKTLDIAKNARTRTSYGFVESRRGGGGGSIEAVRFGELVQMDEREMSAFILFDERRRILLGSLTSSIAVCCATTAIIGWNVGSEPPSSTTALQTLVHCGSMKEVPTLFREDFMDLQHLATRISALLVDGASWYQGETVHDVGGDLVMDVLNAGARKGTQKALVESRHANLRIALEDRLAAHKLPIQLLRDYNIDPAAAAAVDVETARWLFGLCVAEYNVLRRTDLGNRSPLELAIMDRERFGVQMPTDLDQYLRAQGVTIYGRTLRGDGVRHAGLVYARERDQAGLLDDFAKASAREHRTKKKTFEAKIKTYPHTVERISVFNPWTERWEDLRCKRARYSSGLTPRVHAIVRLGFQDGKIERVSEERLIEVRGLVEDAIENADPANLAKHEAAHMRILSDPTTMAIAAERSSVVYQPPSPTGMSFVRHDMDLSRADALQRPILLRRGDVGNSLEDEDGPGSPAGAAGAEGAKPEGVGGHIAPEDPSGTGSSQQERGDDLGDGEAEGGDDHASPFDVY